MSTSQSSSFYWLAICLFSITFRDMLLVDRCCFERLHFKVDLFLDSAVHCTHLPDSLSVVYDSSVFLAVIPTVWTFWMLYATFSVCSCHFDLWQSIFLSTTKFDFRSVCVLLLVSQMCGPLSQNVFSFPFLRFPSSNFIFQLHVVPYTDTFLLYWALHSFIIIAKFSSCWYFDLVPFINTIFLGELFFILSFPSFYDHPRLYTTV